MGLMGATKRLLEKLAEELAEEYCRRNKAKMSEDILENATQAIMDSKNKRLCWEPWVIDWIEKHESQIPQ